MPGPNVGEAEIIVEADSSSVIPEVKGLIARLGAIGDKAGADFGTKFQKRVDKQTKQMGSRFAAKMELIAGVLPLATSGISALAGAATALTGSIARAAVSTAALTGVVGALGAGLIVTTVGFQGMGDAIGGDEEALKKLTPAARESALALAGVGDRLSSVQNLIQQNMFAGLADNFRTLGATLIPAVRDELGLMGTTVNGVIDQVTKWAASESVVRRLQETLRGTNHIMKILGDTAQPILNGLLNLYNALLPASGRLASKIRNVAESFNSWTKGEGFAKRVNEYMLDAEASAHQLWRVIRNLGQALWNILDATADSGDGLMKTLGDLLGTFKRWTASVEGQDAIKNWADTGISAVKSLARIFGTLGPALGALFNPKLIEMFLGLIETITPTLQTVFGVLQSALMPIIEAIGPAFATLGPKIAKLFIALAPLLKGIGAVLGEVITQAFAFLGTMIDIITPIVAIISNVLGPLLQKFAGPIAFVILLFGNLGGTLLKFIPIIRKVAAPLVSLAGNIAQKLIPILGKMMTVVGKVFGFIGKIIGKVMGTVGPVISKTFTAAWKIVVKVSQAIWNAVSSRFTAIRAVVSKIMNGIKTVISAIWGAIKSVFTAGVNAAKNVFGGLSTLIAKGKAIFESVRSAISEKIQAIIARVRELPGKAVAIIEGAGTALLNAGKALMGQLAAGVEQGLQKVKDKITAGLNWIKDKLPGSPIKDGPLVGWNGGAPGKKLFEWLADGIEKAIPAVQSAVNKTLSIISNGMEEVAIGPAVSAITASFEQVGQAIEEATQTRFDRQNELADKQLVKDQKRATNQYKAERERLKKMYDGKKLEKFLDALDKQYEAYNNGLDRKRDKHTKRLEAEQRKGTKALLAQANAQKTAIMAQAAQWDALEAQLAGVTAQYDDALSILQSKTQEMQSLASSVSSSLVQSIWGDDNGGWPVTFESMIKKLEDQQANALRFQSVMERLRAAGLNATSYEQIVAAGVQGLDAAEAMLAQGQAGVDQINAIQGSIDSVATATGDAVAQTMLGAGVALAQETVDALAGQQTVLEAQMITLGEAMATAFKDAMADIVMPSAGDTGGGGEGGGAGGLLKHRWEPISKTNRKCRICGRVRSASVHTNPGGAARGMLSTMGGWMKVGETGPELVKLPEGSRVYPNQQSERMGMSGGGGDHIEIIVNLPTGDPEAAAEAVMTRLARRGRG